jgi:hypothetical protein
MDHIIRTAAELEDLYGPALERSVRKQMDHLDEYCRAFIAASPMVVVATQSRGTGGSPSADASPRGDFAGFVRVADEHTLLIPDRRGNNRIDTLKNLVENPAIGLLFLIPGVHETFRVNGEAALSTDPALTESFAVQGKAPRTVIVVTVKEAYIHCSRALVRADLWNPAKHAGERPVPTMGTVMAAHTRGFVEATAFDEDAKARVPVTLY